MNKPNHIDSEALRQQDAKAEMLNQEVNKLKERGLELNDEMEILTKMIARHKAMELRGKVTEKDNLVYQAVQDRLDVIKDEIETMRQQYGHQVHELLSIDRHGTFISQTSPDDVMPLVGNTDKVARA